MGPRYFSTESMNKLYEPTQEEVVQALLSCRAHRMCEEPRDRIYTISRAVTYAK
jgi:hypothetical protein